MADLSQRLDLKLGQSLVMTPQLQQAIKMLQMTNQELTEFVLSEIEQNPLLERADPETGLSENLAQNDDGSGDAGDAKLARAESDASESGGDNTPNSTSGSEATDSATHADAGTFESGGALDTDYDNVWAGEGGGRGSGGEGADGESWLEQAAAEKPSLRDHLLEQIQLDVTDDSDRWISLLLLEQLDEAGYCKADLNEIAERLGVEPVRVETILKRLQQCDPPGIFARDLAECLALQLHDKGLYTDEMEALVAHLPLLAERSFGQLEKLCGVTREELGQMIQAVRACDPKPAAGWSAVAPPTVIPDVLVRKTGLGQWQVELNQETLPRVLVNERYYAKVKDGTTSKKELDYLAERHQSAHWLSKALHQRAITILKVATALVTAQENFLNFGLDFLKPLILKDIASAIGMHESTVSRVTAGKYMATPKGVFELKYFFSTALGKKEGSAPGAEGHSATMVKARIKSLIDGEIAAKILSDDQLVALLKGEGIEIARRTVAKYREAMRIGSSTERRRLKAGG